jgi:hypothetical protein
MGAHGTIRWPARSPNLNPLDFFIFIGNVRDNECYLIRYPKRGKKKTNASMSGKTPKFFTECISGHF